MTISERELEDLIYQDLVENRGESIFNRGLYISMCKIWERQLNLGPYGIADIVGFDRFHGGIDIQLIELKVVPIDAGCFDQILRYKTAIEEYLDNTLKGKFDYRFVLHLVGPSMSSGHYIHNSIENCIVTEYDIDLNGIRFRGHRGNWHKPTDQILSFKKSLHNGQAVY